jgi:hypothetical protein
MPSGGKRANSGRKKGSKLIKEEVVMIRVPVSLLPLIHTLIAIKKGQGLPWSTHLCFVLLGKLIGYPEDDVFAIKRRMTTLGRMMLDRAAKNLKMPFEEEGNYPPAITKQLEKLEQDRLLFLKDKKGTTHVETMAQTQTSQIFRFKQTS